MSAEFVLSWPTIGFRLNRDSHRPRAKIDSNQAQAHSNSEPDDTADGARYFKGPILAARFGLHANPNRIGILLPGKIRLSLANVRN